MARKIQDILEGQVIRSEMPLANFYVEEPYTFQKNGYVLKLQDEDGLLFRWVRGGRLYWLVANDYEIDVVIWSNRNGYFSAISDDPAYNLTVDSDFFDLQKPSYADSWISFTMRPNSLLGMDIEGDEGKWSYSGDRFNQIIEQVGSAGTRPEGASFIAILTNPYEQYANGRVKTIIGRTLDRNRQEQAFWVEIAAVRKVPPRMQEREGYEGVEEELLPTTISDVDWRILVSPQFPSGAIVTGEDTNDSNWQVSIRESTNTITKVYAVFVDGVFQENTMSESLVTVRNQYVDAIEARRKEAQDYEPTEPPEPLFDTEGIGDILKVGGIGLIVVLGLVAVIVLARR
tara:strand:- start:1592 stop:2623 length:1032 start_codon:yes stop_codon:yes gene_type:complete